jgi:hypothetical protein
MEYERLENTTVWFCRETGVVVVCGDPHAVEPLGCSEDDGHNCDAAACGTLHVLARGRFVGVPRYYTEEE